MELDTLAQVEEKRRFLALLHDITRGISSRPFVLGGVYASVLVFSGWPTLMLSLLGLVDAAIGLRARVKRGRGPPAPT